MDIGQGGNIPEGSQAPQANAEPVVEKKPAKRSWWRIFKNILLILSVIANIVLVIALIGLAGVFIAGGRDTFTEEVIYSGPRTARIAVIGIEGIIEADMARKVNKQLKLAGDDNRVKGIVLRVNSPGGSISGSDQIYNEIMKYRKKTGRPVVAFMQSVAASGGYYTSVACDKIMAEPTAITGSIGVIMGHFVIQQLLEEKLGIQPVVVKSGPRKDWPSPFRPFTEEDKQYIESKLINPAYERFVKVVVDGRKDLTPADVRRLADGSIYGASEALEDKLIDQIGYLDEAIEEVKMLAGIENAEVIEYRRPFSLSELLSSQSKSTLKFDKATLYEFCTPQVLYLWTLGQ